MGNDFGDTLRGAVDVACEKVSKSIHEDWQKAKTRDTRELLHAETRVLSRLRTKLKRELKV